MVLSPHAVELDLLLLRNFAIALFIGALVGIEREKRKERERTSIGGLRTFMLFAIAGAVSAWLSARFDSPFLFVGTGASLTALLVAGYFAERKGPGGEGIGLTTEAAALVVFLLGGACLSGAPEVAVALAIVTSALLALKAPLHGLVRKIGPDDLVAGLKLLFASFIVLPILPREAVDPWGALNPYKLWLLVVLIATLSLAGYVAMRWLGPHRGTAVTGLFGGMVSSTAVTLSFARGSRGLEGAAAKAAANMMAMGLLVAWAVMFVRILVEVAIVHLPLLRAVAVPMVAMGSVAAVGAVFFHRKADAALKTVQPDVVLRNPFSLTSAVRFGLYFAAILLLVKLAQQYVPGRGIYLVALIAGTTDVDAITLSMANEVRDGGDPAVAVTAIVLAAISNTIVKTGMVVALGGTAIRPRIVIASLVILAASAVALLV